MPVIVRVRGQGSGSIVAGTDPSRLVGTERVGAIDYLVAIDIATEAILHRITPCSHWDMSVEFVVGLVIVRQPSIDESLQNQATIEVAIVVDSAVGRARSPIECLDSRLLTGQSHVDVVLFEKEADRVPNLHPPLGVSRLARCPGLSECHSHGD